MTVLVTGATGPVGSAAVADLLAHGVEVRALTRDPTTAELPEGAQAVRGELGDRDAVRSALDGVEGAFLLSPVVPDELTATLLALALAREQGLRAVTYLSVIHADRFTEPAHFAAKHAAERMVADLGLPVTSLRPGYYMQNDLGEQERLAQGVYAPPLGTRGVLAVDTRDLGEVASATLRERLDGPEAPPRVLDVVAPDAITGPSAAAVWTEALGHPVQYAGDDLDHFEDVVMAGAPGWMAHDMRMMFGRFQRDGMTAADGTDAELRRLLGRPMRSYADLVAEAVRGDAA